MQGSVVNATRCNALDPLHRLDGRTAQFDHDVPAFVRATHAWEGQAFRGLCGLRTGSSSHEPEEVVQPSHQACGWRSRNLVGFGQCNAEPARPHRNGCSDWSKYAQQIEISHDVALARIHSTTSQAKERH
jgi:hypothetical protein